ncbi:MAG: phosphatase PAP2 family protein [Spirochaetales bacterium]|nr:phosphatase PAP2 family protein [Spirochaetales bacterium]
MGGCSRLVILIHTFLYAIVLVLALQFADVAVVPGLSKVGLSTLNGWFRNLWHYNDIGYNKFWYYLTEVLGYMSFVACAFWTGLFLREMIKSGGFDGVGVDKNLMATFWLYLIAAVLCVLFRFFTVNYRPIMMPGKTTLTASFPSVHVILFIVAWGSTIFHLIEMLDKQKLLMTCLCIACGVIMAIGIFGRMICGVSWFTDIIGGILIGSNLILLYSFFFDI